MRHRTGDAPAGAVVPEPRTSLEAADLVRASFDATAAFVMVVDARGVPLLVNPALVRATGWTEAQMTARPIWEFLIAPEDVAGAKDHVHRSMTLGQSFPQEGDWMDRAGGRRRVWMQNSVLRGRDGRPWAIVTVGMDVTDQRLAEAALRERAATDLLTGLFNRAALMESLSDALVGPCRSACGLLFADLDGFKSANDRHGHHVGDLVLVEVAARLRRITGPQDVVARLGGDEFVVLCPGADHARLHALSRRVEEELGRPVETPHGPIPIGVSVGTAVAAPGSDPDDVLRAADRSMYGVKVARHRHDAARVPQPAQDMAAPPTPAARARRLRPGRTRQRR